MTLIRFFGGKEGRVWPAITHRHAEALRGANHHIRPHGAGILQQRERHQISGYHHLRFMRFGLFNHRGQIGSHAFAVRVLEQHAKHVRHRLEHHARARYYLQFYAQVFGARFEQRHRLWINRFVHQEPVRSGLGHRPRTRRKRHRHRLSHSRGLIQQRRVGQFHPRQIAHHGLEIQQGLQSPLCNLRLVRCISRVPPWIFQHIPANHAWHFGRVVPHTDVILKHGILGRNAIDVFQVLTFRQSRSQRHAFPLADFARNGLGNQVFDGGGSDCPEHRLLILLAGTDVTRGEFGGVHKRRV